MNKKIRCIYKVSNYSGFFSIYINSLCLIDYCLKNNYVPYADLTGCMYNNPVYDGDLWNIFFEPLVLYPNEEYEIEKEIFFNPSKDKYDIPLYSYKYFPETKKDREKCNKVVKYIKIKKEILDEVENFVKNNFDTPVLGVHIRKNQSNLFEYKKVLNNFSIKGSELDTDRIGPTFEMYVDEIIKFLDKNPTYKVFLATDNGMIYKILKKYEGIKDKLIKYPTTFLGIGRAIDRVRTSEKDGIKLAKDVLIDTLLLSKCNHFIWSYSNIAAAVLIMNLELTYTNITSYLKNGGKN